MNFYLYSIRDKYTGFMAPAPNVNDEAAKRDFAYAINNNPGIMNFSPGDYDLYCIGTFDNHSGVVEQLETNIMICNGLEVFNAKSES